MLNDLKTDHVIDESDLYLLPQADIEDWEAFLLDPELD